MPFGDGSGEGNKRLAVIGVASLFLLTMVVLGVLVGMHAAEKKEDDGGPTASRKAIDNICQPTDYKETCKRSLQHAKPKSDDPHELIKAAFHAALRELEDISSRSTLLKELEKDAKTTKPVRVCRELFQDAVDDFSRSMDEVGKIDLNNMNKMLETLKVWISATITYQETCLDAFQNTTTDAAERVKKLLTISMQMSSNCMAIASGMSSALGDLDLKGVSINGRRLLTIWPENYVAGHDVFMDDDFITKMSRLTKKGKELTVADDTFPRWFDLDDRRRKLMAAQPGKDLNPNVVVAQDGSSKFRRIVDALGLIPKDNKETFVVYVKQGVYYEYVQFEKWHTNVVLIGDGPAKTRISGNKNYIDGTPTYQTSTLTVLGDHFMAKDIGVENTAGSAKHQAVAMRVQADMSVFYNCHFDGYQDTLYAHTYRQFYRDCQISGTIDFIFGDAAAFLQNCTFIVRKPLENQNCIVTAQGRKERHQASGIVIHNCKFTSDPDYFPVRFTNKAYLGRPWKEFSKTIIMESDIDDLIQPQGWLEWEGNFGLDTCYYGEFENRGPGAKMDKRVKWRGIKTISPDLAIKFMPPIYFADDGWIKVSGVPYVATLSSVAVSPAPQDENPNDSLESSIESSSSKPSKDSSSSNSSSKPDSSSGSSSDSSSKPDSSSGSSSDSSSKSDSSSGLSTDSSSKPNSSNSSPKSDSSSGSSSDSSSKSDSSSGSTSNSSSKSDSSSGSSSDSPPKSDSSSGSSSNSSSKSDSSSGSSPNSSSGFSSDSSSKSDSSSGSSSDSSSSSGSSSDSSSESDSSSGSSSDSSSMSSSGTAKDSSSESPSKSPKESSSGSLTVSSSEASKGSSPSSSPESSPSSSPESSQSSSPESSNEAPTPSPESVSSIDSSPESSTPPAPEPSSESPTPSPASSPSEPESPNSPAPAPSDSESPLSSPATPSKSESPASSPAPSPSALESSTPSPAPTPTAPEPSTYSPPTSESSTSSPARAPSTPKSPTSSPSSAPSTPESPTSPPSSALSTSESPTPSPSSAPSTSESPMPSPSSAPSTSESPTSSPSSAPSTSESPTPSPSSAPSTSESPTSSPSSAPSASESPTSSPSSAPSTSESPTSSPSSAPSASESPTSSPSSAPNTLESPTTSSSPSPSTLETPTESPSPATSVRSTLSQRNLTEKDETKNPSHIEHPSSTVNLERALMQDDQEYQSPSSDPLHRSLADANAASNANMPSGIDAAELDKIASALDKFLSSSPPLPPEAEALGSAPPGQIKEDQAADFMDDTYLLNSGSNLMYEVCCWFSVFVVLVTLLV